MMCKRCKKVRWRETWKKRTNDFWSYFSYSSVQDRTQSVWHGYCLQFLSCHHFAKSLELSQMNDFVKISRRCQSALPRKVKVWMNVSVFALLSLTLKNLGKQFRQKNFLRKISREGKKRCNDIGVKAFWQRHFLVRMQDPDKNASKCGSCH